MLATPQASSNLLQDARWRARSLHTRAHTPTNAAPPLLVRNEQQGAAVLGPLALLLTLLKLLVTKQQQQQQAAVVCVCGAAAETRHNKMCVRRLPLAAAFLPTAAAADAAAAAHTLGVQRVCLLKLLAKGTFCVFTYVCVSAGDGGTSASPRFSDQKNKKR